MFVHPEFNPVAIQIGPLAVRWYGLMYLAGFIAFITLSKRRLKFFPAIKELDVDNLLTWGVLGVILGGRLGYVLFYKPDYYLHNPTEILAIWEGGMSFHGGFLGVLLTCLVYCKVKGWNFFDLMDFVAPSVPLGLAFGRLGNFINGELWGRPTDGWWGVVFPQAGDLLPRHPSQLYQMSLEGFALFAWLWWFSSKPRSRAAISAWFMMGYGGARFIVEYAREPDRFLGTLSLGLSMGQWLCLPMILLGLVLLAWSRGKPTALQTMAPRP
ncbi:prolipoprotein diacylglyceryl transferase [Limnobacter humi]|uniref:Phosphatidylglycerol--prolipoprotein diacylglyceryl transferase n=1 Tax=Limnobacter humi TaxID=1778671 RepID=A0ABT1WFQ1_9BURK|nr:prolipoprotein diacylglyceryl transferase [Limnobacter humi]MCQ8896338.1 prolipoprotein diacylglyceryl transferase [Limnobacter humi]